MLKSKIKQKSDKNTVNRSNEVRHVLKKDAKRKELGTSESSSARHTRDYYIISKMVGESVICCVFIFLFYRIIEFDF